MCSIDGYTGQHDFTIEQFGSLNSDRGPDGTHYYKSPELSIAHSLLAIQPNPSNLQQPVVSPTTGNVLAYNGEIFNAPGFDTQYLMEMLELADYRALNNDVHGMWAFVFYDRSKQTITMARDHFGVKGLYYMEINNQLLFASTPKPLYAALNAMNFKIHANNYAQEYLKYADTLTVVRIMAGTYGRIMIGSYTVRELPYNTLKDSALVR